MRIILPLSCSFASSVHLHFNPANIYPCLILGRFVKISKAQSFCRTGAWDCKSSDEGLFLGMFLCSKHYAIPAETSRSWSIKPLPSMSAPADNQTSYCCRYKGIGGVYKGPLSLSAICLHRLKWIQCSLPSMIQNWNKIMVFIRVMLAKTHTSPCLWSIHKDQPDKGHLTSRNFSEAFGLGKALTGN